MSKSKGKNPARASERRRNVRSVLHHGPFNSNRYRTNFSNPVSNQSNANFGKIQSAGSPRIMQFALKYAF